MQFLSTACVMSVTICKKNYRNVSAITEVYTSTCKTVQVCYTNSIFFLLFTQVLQRFLLVHVTLKGFLLLHLTWKEIHRAEILLQFAQEHSKKAVRWERGHILRALVIHHHFLLAINFNLKYKELWVKQEGGRWLKAPHYHLHQGSHIFPITAVQIYRFLMHLLTKEILFYTS